MKSVPVAERPLRSLLPILGAERFHALVQAAERTRRSLGGRTVWQVNTTAAGGGVAELSHALLPYARAAGIDVRWLVLGADARFTHIGKRLCLLLYGHREVPEPGDGDHAHYTEVCARAAAHLEARMRPGDVVVLHDPQTAGLAAPLKRAGATVVWRCHIGSDTPTDRTARTWQWIAPHLDAADLLVFSTERHIPTPWNTRRTTPGRLPHPTPEAAASSRAATPRGPLPVQEAHPHPRIRVIAPCIDPLSVKNRAISPGSARDMLTAAGVLAPVTLPVAAPPRKRPPQPCARAVRVTDGPPPPPEAPLITQISRWDVLKDMRGVLTAFAEQVHDLADAHLVLAGPDVAGVADDPGGAAVLQDCHEAWRRLPPRTRRRVHLLTVPMEDPSANAALTSALQRHAAVVVQKSLAEGFGLTVTEAMWKSRPVIASAVGGIADQIRDERDGLLLADPRDRAALGRRLARVLSEPSLARGLGGSARERVNDAFLPDRHLTQWAEALADLHA